MKKRDTVTVAILFDLEGTLIQTEWEKPDHIVLFRGETRRKLLDLGIPPIALEGDERSTVMRNNALDYAKQNFDETRIKQFQLGMQRFLEKYEMSVVKTSRLFPETIPTLRQLKTLGCCIGLVTNTSKKAVADYFSMYALGNYFDVAVTRDDVSKLKPDPEGVLLAIKKLGKQRFFLVGDLEHDAIAARKAGGLSIIVNRDSSRMPRFQADFFVKSLSEVPIIVSSNNPGEPPFAER